LKVNKKVKVNFLSYGYVGTCPLCHYMHSLCINLLFMMYISRKMLVNVIEVEWSVGYESFFGKGFDHFKLLYVYYI